MKKGTTNNPNGRPSGSKNRRTVEWEALGEAISSTHCNRFSEVLNDMDDEAFARNYLLILEYFKPKQQRTEVKNEDGNEIIIRVVRDGDKHKPKKSS